MNLYISLKSVTKALKKFRDCRLDTFLIHAVAQSFDGTFSPDAIKSVVGISEGKINGVLKRSQFIKSDGDLYEKRLKLDTIYKDSVVEYKNGQLEIVKLKDRYSPDILLHDPVIDYNLSVLKKYGDILGLLDITVMTAIQEKNQTKKAIFKRLQFDDSNVASSIDRLLQHELIVMKNMGGVYHYHLSAKGSDVWSLLYNQSV
ncbi:hypothetical protein GZ77_21275 [Endozoicomonas montiporae]|uniref:Uncharacterized protein n=2 Tax=Endozoicomonas montiporae TaxID=1027273 RepID=A0A081N3D9_9GAMM|nr:hypothetical protein [Endozoicomonas montiporae]AMO58263.1 hypothetical protein EZMO1_4346 [Endozoicomonas montiporae CL-33]KEQ12962.1 hypothetical protein GZ77_21275 [Endozoicomonas montiporae]